MTIRILQSIASMAWSYAPGQVIDVPTLTPELRAWLADGRAEVVRDITVEEATADMTTEQAVVRRRRRES